MGILEDALNDFEFEGTYIGGVISFKKVDEEAEKVMTDEQKLDIKDSISELQEEIGDKFGDDTDELLTWITTAAKLRVLIGRRMKNLKKIPQEFVDKYNETVTDIRKIIRKKKSEE